jgi:hypothetical protein
MVINMGGEVRKLGIAFVFREENTFFSTGVHFASMIDNLVLEVQYF